MKPTFLQLAGRPHEANQMRGGDAARSKPYACFHTGSFIIKASAFALFALTIAALVSPARSATLTPLTPSPIDFGSVVIGDSSFVPVDYYYSMDAGEVFVDVGAFVSSGTDFHASGLSMVSFAPTAVGSLSDVLHVFLTYLNSTGQFDRIFISFDLHGIGLPQSSPVPLPLTLPLSASGLVGLGLLDWRRKRKTVDFVRR